MSTGCHGLFNLKVDFDDGFDRHEVATADGGDVGDYHVEETDRPAFWRQQNSAHTLRNCNFLELLFAGELVSSAETISFHV